MIKLKSLCDLTLNQFQDELKLMDIPAFRAKQIFQWIFDKGVFDFNQMTNLPKSLQNELQLVYKISPLEIANKQVSRLDGTTKLLYKLADGETIEAVMMIYGARAKPERVTVCVSTQVGCRMGCSFCATGLGGFQRNLTKGEIVGQVLGFQQYLKRKESSLRVSNVVYMGMGEPLLNYDNVLASIKMLNQKEIFNISYRRITISTCGLAPQIIKLADELLPIGLAISLHASSDLTRSKIMPVNKKYGINDLLKACRYYNEVTGRKVTFEYIMLANVNDSLADAQGLAKIIKGMKANVNLIPFNEVTETGHWRSNKIKVNLFAAHLGRLGIEVVVREEKGGDILAACGQLRQAKQVNRGEL